MKKDNFLLGCNYWASNAGTEMWVNWDEAAIEKDLKCLSENGLRYLRVFPNWRDFQPVCGYYEYANMRREYRHKNGSRFTNPYYLDEEMMNRFERFCEIAAKYDFELIVGLITGWMSGRIFAPPILDGRNLFTDEIALVLEQKFIKGFVSRFYDNDVIYAWDLGNECNCLSIAANREVAASWTATIVNAIRANDPLRKPVISGMHSLSIDKEWTIFDQGENVDVLTTHPYPFFVEYCYKDDMLSFRTLMHATCEGVYYSDLSGKPCLTEEIGTLGPMICDNATSAAFLRTNLYSNWANGSTGVLWWCGCEQVHLTTPPYTWGMIERELGLMNVDGSPKEMLITYGAFAKWLKNFGKEIPKPKVDAVCVLTMQQKHWGVAYMTYALAKQAHINLQFTYGEQLELPDSDIYLMPSIAGTGVLSKESLDRLKEKVFQGATLYISNDTGFIAEFEKLSGVHVKNSMMIDDKGIMELDDVETNRKVQITFERTKRYFIEASTAEVLAYDNLGMPAFTRHTYGKGYVYYLNFPLETMLLDKNYAFDNGCHKVYSALFEEVKKKHPVSVKNPYVGVTYHNAGEETYVVLINYSSKEQEIGLTVNDDYKIVGVYGGAEIKQESVEGMLESLPANEAVVITVKKVVK